MQVLLLLASMFAYAPQEPAPAAELPVLYLVSAPTDVHSAPALASATCGRLRPFDIVTGRQANGWLEIESSSGGIEGGWIQIVDENILHGSIGKLKDRVFRASRTRWPDRVKLDVVRGQVRVGFTADQVELALGDPLSKQLVGTGGNATETWMYPDRRISFSHAGVSAIERLEPQR